MKPLFLQAVGRDSGLRAGHSRAAAARTPFDFMQPHAYRPALMRAGNGAHGRIARKDGVLHATPARQPADGFRPVGTTANRDAIGRVADINPARGLSQWVCP